MSGTTTTTVLTAEAAQAAFDADMVAIRAKVELWLNSGGIDQIKAAMARADAANRQMAEDARIDWWTMMEPVTI